MVTVQALVSAAALVVEILAGRMLAPYVGMSIYTWTAVIAVVLAGLSVGHWVGGLLAQKPRRNSLGLTAVCLGFASLTTALTLVFLRWFSAGILSNAPGPGAAILTLATIVVFLPSFFAGTPAPVLARAAVDLKPGAEGKALGAIFAAGSIGAIAGTLATGFVFIAWLGTSITIVAVALLYAALAVVLAIAAGQKRYHIAVICSLLAAAALCAYNLTAQPVCTKESRYYCIRILDFTGQVGAPAKLMVLDHLGHGINVAGHPGQLVTPYVALIDNVITKRLGGKPRSSFFIGGGAYTLPRAWLAAEPQARITVSEIDPDVTLLARKEMWLQDTGMTVVHQDARIALRHSPGQYQVIIGDAFTDIAVPAHLVTLEFFQLVRSKLARDGIYAMNVVDHSGRTAAMLSVYRTLRAAFDNVEVVVEEGDLASGGRTTFVLFASALPSGLTRLIDANDSDRTFVWLAPQRLQDLALKLDVPLLTDDYSPIDRLVAIGEL
jgi:predicted membrane-bound spermidine synthase